MTGRAGPGRPAGGQGLWRGANGLGSWRGASGLGSWRGADGVRPRHETGSDRAERDPFAVLGLHAADDLSDDDMRIAWRRLAAATHPDRADGGDPERFALAAAAYTELRTAFGRNEARADLEGLVGAAGVGAAGVGARPAGATAAPRAQSAGRAGITSRIRDGRPGRLLLRFAITAVAAAVGVIAAGQGSPAAPALAVGALTWLLVTARHDLSD